MEEKKKKEKNLVYIIILLVLLLIVVIIGYMLANNNDKGNMTNKTTGHDKDDTVFHNGNKTTVEKAGLSFVITKANIEGKKITITFEVGKGDKIDATYLSLGKVFDNYIPRVEETNEVYTYGIDEYSYFKKGIIKSDKKIGTRTTYVVEFDGEKELTKSTDLTLRFYIKGDYYDSTITVNPQDSE